MKELLRDAWLCHHKDCDPPTRIFLLPGDPSPPRCPLHGATMRRQANLPYDPAKVALSGPPRAVDTPKGRKR